jgi:phosphoglycolate phosphatase-like HAD superfamily hydrolase
VMRLLCCDVDGTIFNSRELVRRAYASVGVAQPDASWGLCWQDWLIDYFDGDKLKALTVHSQKTEAYVSLLIRTDLKQYELPTTAVARTWRKRYGDKSVSYLTAGTASTASSVVQRLNIAGTLLGGLRYEQRLSALLNVPHGTVYLDDNAETIANLHRDAPGIHAIDIRDLTVDDIMRRIAQMVGSKP